MTWYRAVLGLAVETGGGAVRRDDAPGHPPAVTVTAFREGIDIMAPSRREFMINFAGDDLDAKRDDSDPYSLNTASMLFPSGSSRKAA